MRRLPLIFISSLALTAPALCQESKTTSTEELRVSVSEWVETMRKIQQEENEWTRDQEVLKNYKEGLEKEISDLKEQISLAKTRKEGGDQQSLDKVSSNNDYIATENELTRQLRIFEEDLAKKIPILPEPLKRTARITQCIETLQGSLLLGAESQSKDVAKRLANITELMAEVEKCQQGIHVHSELHRDSQGREFNMQVVYFGLALAYAVNEDGSFALAGRAAPDGWKFQERNDLAPRILKLVASATSEKEVSFTNLPLIQP
jgi:hypothetical protein